MLAEKNNINLRNDRITNYEKTKFDIDKIKIDFSNSIKGETEYNILDSDLQELAESIKTVGLIQPIVIRKISNDNYEVIAGRRRFTAISKILKWKTIEAIVREYDDSIDTLAVQFQENEERKAWTDFNYVTAIKMLREKKPGISTLEIAKTFNKSPDWVKKKNDHIRVVNSFENVGATAHLDISELSTSEINATGKVKDESARVDLITDILEAKGRGENLTIVEIRDKAQAQGEAKQKNQKLAPNVRKFEKPIQQDLIPKSDYQIYDELRENILASLNRISAVDSQIEGLKERKEIYLTEKEKAEKEFKKFELENRSIKLKNRCDTVDMKPLFLKRFTFETCLPYRENELFLKAYHRKGWIGKLEMEGILKTASNYIELKFSEVKKGVVIFAPREADGVITGWFKCEVI